MFLKKISLFHFLPASLAALLCLAFVKNYPTTAPDLNFSAQQSKSFSYIPHFKPYELSEQVAFSLALKQSVPVLLGSSELTSNHLKGLAHNYFNDPEQNNKLFSLGHAGFQSLGILTVLAANKELLKSSKITIILSPGWFEKQYCGGISLKSFFEYATPNYMYQILKDTSIDANTRNYIAGYVQGNFDKISSPDEAMRLFNKTSNFELNRAANYPFKKLNETELKRRGQTDLYLISQQVILKSLRELKIPKYKFNSAIVNWDSLMRDAKIEFKKISTNNNQAVENVYYDKWLKNKRKKQLIAVDKSLNQEYKDFVALVEFLKAAGCHPAFVIMPLNPKAHEDLSVLQPIVNEVNEVLKTADFKTLNMFNSNTSQYEDGLLEDIMHPYNLGWYKIDKFILETYADGNK